MLSSKLGWEGRALFVMPTIFGISGDEQQGARRSPVGIKRGPPLVCMAERGAVLPSSELSDGGRGRAAR